MPAWTSSTTRRIPRSSKIRRSPARKTSAAGIMPGSPWMPSRNMPAVVSEPGTGAHHARLDLVDDEEDPPLVADPAQPGEEALRCRDHAGLALDGLQEDASGVLVSHGVNGVEVAVGVVLHARGHRFEGLALIRLAGQRQRAHRAAVEAALGGP